MTDVGQDDSFDPRSWSRKAPAGSPAPQEAPEKAATPTGEPSFDPATWPGAARPKRTSEAVVPANAPTVRARSTHMLITVAVVVLLAVVGAAAAFLSRSPPPAAPVHHAQPHRVVLAETPKQQVYSPPPPSFVPGHSQRTVTIAGPDRIAGAIANLGVDAAEVSELTKRVLASVGAGPGELRLTADVAQSSDGKQSVSWLEVNRIDGSGVRLLANGTGYEAQKLAARLTTRIIAARGEMGNTTFYNSAVEAGVDDSLISDFAGAFNYDVDFQFELHPGDVFEAAFEQDYNPWNEPVGPPRLLFASLRLQDKSLQFYRFEADGKYGWFDVSGRSNRRSFMRTPVDGARISSGFGMRFHPVLHYTRMHKGTDFAAPIGTAVYASGDAKVMVAACCHGDAGTMIALQHDNGWVTHYFHLSKIMPGIVPGVRVTQGEKIGEVGMSGGHVTGPHLHYEVIVNGEPVDPMKVDTGQGVTLAGAQLTAFKRERDRIDAARAAGSL